FLAAVASSCSIALGCLHTEAGELTGAVIATAGQDPIALERGADGDKWSELERLLRDASITKVAHDLKRDLRGFEPELADAIDPAFDVMIASYVLEASPGHRIEQLATELLGQSLSEYRKDEQCLGAGVAMLPALYEQMSRQIEDRTLRQLFYEIEMPLVTVLAEMERRGMLVDVAALAAIGDELAANLIELERDIYELAGGPFNIGSAPQLREILFERLQLSRKGVKRGKTGLSTDVDVLNKLALEHPLPAKILQHRALAKVKSTYIDALPQAVRAATGRLHTTFNQAVAVTGRLSSSDPNLQNIPIRTDYGRRIRAAFIAAPGCVLIGADYSQIELRVLAHLSGDPALVEAFATDADVHASTAAQVFNVLPGMVSPEMRRVAKVINFGIIYGMGPQRLARELGIPLAQADQYIRDYFARYAGVKSYMDNIREQARASGYVTTIFGRRRMLPDLNSRDRNLVQAAERTATNTPIQGSAADLIKVAMVAIHRRLRQERLQAGLVLQVHDELLVEAAQADAERALIVVREEMEQVYPMAVPLRVDAAIGQNWAELH
ncbi:MAG TPA: DNA polymerase I, partial [Terriglobales bacterium]|nr:DNA polymerase I [Terriglobales bacterium]